MTGGFGEFSLYLQALLDVCIPLFCWLSCRKPTAFLPILFLLPAHSCSLFPGVVLQMLVPGQLLSPSLWALDIFCPDLLPLI